MASDTIRATQFFSMTDKEQEEYLTQRNLEVVGYSEYGADGKPKFVELRTPVAALVRIGDENEPNPV